VNERVARMTVAVAKFDAEAEPSLALTVYKAATGRTAGEFVLDLMERPISALTGAPIDALNQKHMQ